jgi:hypothetical protein
VLQMAMSILVALAGLVLVITADTADYRLFGWLFLVLGVLGMASRLVVRALRR